MTIISNVLLILGVWSLIISGLGMLRLPTFLTRIHPAAKTTTLGIIFFFSGVAIQHPEWAPKLLVAVILFMFTGPVSASALARTALSDEEREKFYATEKDDEIAEEKGDE
jgi:monovalent cation/proton antiporter MnhG/PhaG subunit